MAIPQNRTELKEYCLRKLGKPVIEINVDDTQVEDRIDEALQYYVEYHIDGTEKVYYIYTVTQTDIDQKFIDAFQISPNILTINKIVDVDSSGSNFMSSLYQYRLDMEKNLTINPDAVSYQIGMSHLSMMRDMFRTGEGVSFNRNTNKIKITRDWNTFQAGVSKIAFEVYETIEEDYYEDIFSDIWLKKYATAKIKEQWGNNMKKMSGIQLAGGVTLNGKEIWDESQEEIKDLEEELDDYPLDMFIG